VDRGTADSGVDHSGPGSSCARRVIWGSIATVRPRPRGLVSGASNYRLRMTEAETLEALLSFARNRGVTARLVSDKEFAALVRRCNLEEAPFASSCLGIVWKTKRLYYTRDALWPEVIHELGHLLASRMPPRSSSEYEFFGWELALVHHLGASVDRWLASNKHYGVNNEKELGALSPLELHTMLAERLMTAKGAGLIDTSDGHPLVIR